MRVVAEGEWSVTDFGSGTGAFCRNGSVDSLDEHIRCKSARGPQIEEPGM